MMELFFGMGLSGVAPIFHKLIDYRNQPEALQTTGFEILVGILYGIGRCDIRRYKNSSPMEARLFHLLIIDLLD